MKKVYLFILMVFAGLSGAKAAAGDAADWYLYFYSGTYGLSGDAGQFVESSTAGVYVLEGCYVPGSGISFCIRNSAWSTMYGWGTKEVAATGTPVTLASASSANGWLAINAGTYDVTWNTNDLTIQFDENTSAPQATTYYTKGDGDENSFEFESTDGTTATIKKVYLDANATSLTIPDTVWSNVEPYPPFKVTAVGKGAAIATGASAITSLTIEEGVVEVGASAFVSWTGLTTLSLPSTLTTIGNNAFQNCDALTSITSWSTAVVLGTHAFEGNSSWDAIAANCVVKVPDGCVANYAAYSFDNTQTWTYWDQFYTNHKIHELSYPSITTAGWSTYYNEYGYTMPEGVEGYIIDWTYNDTANLVKIYNPGDKVCDKIALLWKSTADLTDETWYTVEALASGGNTATWPTYVDTSNETQYYQNELNGTQAKQTITAYSGNYYYYKLANGANGLGWYWGEASGGVFENGAHKAYLALEQTSTARGFISMFDDETTGIADVRSKKDDVRNGYYDLQGRRVTQPTKGLYIVNGKKFFNK